MKQRHWRARDLVSRHLYYSLLPSMRGGFSQQCQQLYREKSRAQRLPRAELELAQDRLLLGLLKFCFQHNPFYRERMRNAGLVSEHDFHGEGLRQLPVLSKRDLQENFAALTSEGVDRTGWRENASGGSTGNPVNFLQDENYQAHNRATAWVSDSMQGWEPGARCARLWGAPKDSNWFNTLEGRVVSYLRNGNLYDSFDMNAARMRQFHGHLTRFRPDIIIAYASSIYLYARFLMEAEVRPAYPLRSIISSAETLSEPMRAAVSRCFQVPVYNRYGSREAGILASECEAHRGLHLHVLDHLVEVVDLESGERIWEKPGRILVTLLTNRAMPLLRYDTGDVGIMTRESCSCGRSTPLLQQVLGRSSDFVRSPSGRLIHGEYFTHAFYGHRGIRQFQFIQETPTRFRVRVVRTPQFHMASLQAIRSDIESVLGEAASVEFEFPQSIPATASGKWRFTVSKVTAP